jgi:hypothetical protein
MKKEDQDLVDSMSKAAGGLLIVSVFLGFVLIPLSIVVGSGFSRYLLPILVFDACSLLSVCSLIYAIYRKQEDSTSVDLYAKSGPGMLFLIAALVLRLLCNPALFIVVVLICLSLLLCVIYCFAACANVSAPDYYHVIVTPVGYFYE